VNLFSKDRSLWEFSPKKSIKKDLEKWNEIYFILRIQLGIKSLIRNWIYLLLIRSNCSDTMINQKKLKKSQIFFFTGKWNQWIKINLENLQRKNERYFLVFDILTTIDIQYFKVFSNVRLRFRLDLNKILKNNIFLYKTEEFVKYQMISFIWLIHQLIFVDIIPLIYLSISF
jgi:hypothetical protein